MTRAALNRIVSSAAALGGNARAADRFLQKHVLLTADTRALMTGNGRTCFEAALHLLIRTCSSVAVQAPTEMHDWLIDLLAAHAEHPLASHRHLVQPDESLVVRHFDAVLHVGDEPAAHTHLTTIHSDGWIMRLASDAPPVPMTADKPNALGAIGAAAFGAAEVFKRLVEVRPERGPLHSRLEFSLWDYSTEPMENGAGLPEVLDLSILIAGLGAIGSAIAYVLKRLPATGIAWLVDPQQYGEENLGTSIALDQYGLTEDKVAFIGRYLGPQFESVPHPYDLRTAQSKYNASRTRPGTLLGALDKIPSRHDLQDFWPDLILDGALSASFACQVSRWRYGENTGCLRCQFVEPELDSVATAAAATGLARHRISDAHSPVNAADVAAAPEAHRERLTAAIGRPICSVVQEGMLEYLSGRKAAQRVAPSVPFVAVLSAVMVVGELIKQQIPSAPLLRDAFHFDVLFGPDTGMFLTNARRLGCKCSTSVGLIQRFREMLAER
jgi:hypothetical protein